MKTQIWIIFVLLLFLTNLCLAQSPPQIIEKKYQRLQGDIWKDGWHCYYVYDEEGMLTHNTYVYLFDDGSIFLQRKIIYEYNNLDSLITQTVQDLINGVWTTQRRVVCEYDENNNLTNEIRQEPLNGVWEGNWLNTFCDGYVFDNEGKIIKKNTYKWVNPNWVLIEYDTLSYNVNGLLIQEMTISENDGIWENEQNKIFTYDNNNMLVNRLIENWANDLWINTYQDNYEYYDSGKLMRSTTQHWENQQWENLSGLYYIYNDNGYLDTLYTETWYSDNYGSIWIRNERTITYYSDILFTGDISISKKYQLFQNYPNPFNPSTTIKYALPKESEIKISIYDILGKKITELVNEIKPAGYHEIEFEASNLPSGLYFYQINADNYSDTKKMILLK